MFIGEYYSQIGEKNRIAIPKKLRDKVNDTLLITRGFEKSLMLLDQVSWNKVKNDFKFPSLVSKDVRELKRFLVGGMQEIELDSQGRFVIPESLIKFAHLKNRVVFIGVGEWFELWDFEEWEEHLENLSRNIEGIAEGLK